MSTIRNKIVADRLAFGSFSVRESSVRANNWLYETQGMKLCQQSTMTTENKSACGSSPLGTAVYITLRLLMGATFDFPKLLFANLSNLPIPINHPSILGILIFIQCVYACTCLFSSSYRTGSFLFSVSRGIAMSRPNVIHWHYIVIWHSN